MSDTQKKTRLAEALRANLRKRKAQSRAQATPEPDLPPPGDQRVCIQTAAERAKP